MYFRLGTFCSNIYTVKMNLMKCYVRACGGGNLRPPPIDNGVCRYLYVMSGDLAYFFFNIKAVIYSIRVTNTN